MSQGGGELLKIQPDRFVHYLHTFFIWNSNEQSPDMKIPRSKTLLVGFIISRSGFTYTLVPFEDSDEL